MSQKSEAVRKVNLLDTESTRVAFKGSFGLCEVWQQFQGLVAKPWRLGNNKFNHFEKWLLQRRLYASLSGIPQDDPLIPNGGKGSSGADFWFDKELSDRLLNAGASEQQARSICAQLGKHAGFALTSVQGARRPWQPVRVTETPFVSKGGVDRVTVAAERVELTINQLHRDKLATLFARREADETGSGPRQTGEAKGPRPPTVSEAIFVLLLRYSALQGGGTRGGGYQAALPESCFDRLREDFGVEAELFASPLNCRFPRFCSAFPDVDGPFGSLGGFADLMDSLSVTARTALVSDGAGDVSLEANPPFEPALVSALAARVDALLDQGTRTSTNKSGKSTKGSGSGSGSTAVSGRALSVIVIIPHWPDQACWRALRSSPHCAEHLMLPRFQHAFVEGDQHLQKNRFKLSVHDTSVFFMQNAAGRARWPATPEKLARLVEAFQPIERAKRLSQRGDAAGGGGRGTGSGAAGSSAREGSGATERQTQRQRAGEVKQRPDHRQCQWQAERVQQMRRVPVPDADAEADLVAEGDVIAGEIAASSTKTTRKKRKRPEPEPEPEPGQAPPGPRKSKKRKHREPDPEAETEPQAEAEPEPEPSKRRKRPEPETEEAEPQPPKRRKRKEPEPEPEPDPEPEPRKRRKQKPGPAAAAEPVPVPASKHKRRQEAPAPVPAPDGESEPVPAVVDHVVIKKQKRRSAIA